MIEEAFFLTQSLKKWPHQLNSTIFSVHCTKANLPSPAPEISPKDEDIDRLKYILICEIKAPDNIIQEIDLVQEDLAK